MRNRPTNPVSGKCGLPVRAMVLLIASSLLAACASKPTPGTSEWLVGTWTTYPPTRGPIVFTPDGYAVIKRPEAQNVKLTWSLSGRTLSVTQDGRNLPDATLFDITQDSFRGERTLERDQLDLVFFTRSTDPANNSLHPEDGE